MDLLLDYLLVSSHISSFQKLPSKFQKLFFLSLELHFLPEERRFVNCQEVLKINKHSLTCGKFALVALQILEIKKLLAMFVENGLLLRFSQLFDGLWRNLGSLS